MRYIACLSECFSVCSNILTTASWVARGVKEPKCVWTGLLLRHKYAQHALSTLHSHATSGYLVIKPSAGLAQVNEGLAL